MYVISSREGNNDNGCVVDALMQLTDEPPVIAFSINKVNMTHDMVMNSKEFNISVLTEEAPKELFRLFSAKSGRFIAKFDEFSDAKRSENGIYHLTKYVNAVFSGKIIDAIDAGTHTLFRGEIQSAEVISGDKTLSYSDYRREVRYRQMFCFQCQQTAKGSGCTMSGVCGKKPETAVTQDILTCELISLAVAIQEKYLDYSSVLDLIDLIIEGLFTCVTNVNFNTEKIAALSAEVSANREKLGGIEIITHEELFSGDENIRSLRSALLFGMRGMAAYAHHARILGKRGRDVDNWFIKGMSALGMEHTANEWLGLLMEFGGINLRCMEILESANIGVYGNPEPARVSLRIERGPFIVITGHDLHDLQLLLEQTNGGGVNVYTHGEMLAAHGYPGLRKYSHLKGHFGAAWQNQQNEFKDLPAPILFTANCIMPPRESYIGRVYTTSVVHYPQTIHIEEDANDNKDYSVLIDHAIKLGGFSEDNQFTGMNGGLAVTTGYGRQTVLNNAPAIVDAVKAGVIKHFFLVGGCDGAHSSRNYYTDFVKQTPHDTIVLTLACGKFRFNDIDAGYIGPFPRILDMGQCNDAYGAVEVVAALAEALNCGVNDLPLTFVLSWYEQKAICILLTLLSLGIRNIYIGPSVPAFFSETILKVMIEKFNLHLISAPEKDLEQILKK
ncbi:MAG: hydroxylamine reductase [Treponema sp.]|nr:hydroxylamine reductase [Treponema sp.]